MLARAQGGIPELSKKSGCSDAVIRKWVRGESLPTLDRLVELSRAAQVSVEWLITGQGPMRREDATSTTNGDYVYVPRYDMTVPTGPETPVAGEHIREYRPFKAADLRRLGPINNLTIIEVRGESMTPTLSPGDEVLLDTTDLAGALPDGIYAVLINDTLMIKRIQQLPGGRLIVSSDNPAYRSFEVTLGEAAERFGVVGRAVWCGKRL